MYEIKPDNVGTEENDYEKPKVKPDFYSLFVFGAFLFVVLVVPQLIADCF